MCFSFAFCRKSKWVRKKVSKMTDWKIQLKKTSPLSDLCKQQWLPLSHLQWCEGSQFEKCWTLQRWEWKCEVFLFLHSWLFLSSRIWQSFGFLELIKNFTMSSHVLLTLRQLTYVGSGKARIFLRIKCNPRLKNSSTKLFSDGVPTSKILTSKKWKILTPKALKRCKTLLAGAPQG